MDISLVGRAVRMGSIEWNRHALERMFERGIGREAVKKVLITGEVIEDYPHGTPYPSALFLGFTNNDPLHVVAAFDAESERCYVVTVYVPDLEHFEDDYKRRRQHE